MHTHVHERSPHRHISIERAKYTAKSVYREYFMLFISLPTCHAPHTTHQAEACHSSHTAVVLEVSACLDTSNRTELLNGISAKLSGQFIRVSPTTHTRTRTHFGTFLLQFLSVSSNVRVSKIRRVLNVNQSRRTPKLL